MKKLICMLLALALLCTCAISVFAEDEGEEETLLEVKSITFASKVEGEVTESVRGGAADNTVLIDGDFHEGNETNHQAKGLVLICNTRCTEAGVYPEYTYTLELAEEGAFDAIKIGLYEAYMYMIGFPKDNKVGIESSDNGTDWDLVGDYTLEGEAESTEYAVVIHTIDLGKIVTGKFIRLTFAFGDSPFAEKVVWEWHGFSEFGVVEADAIVVEESQADPEVSEEESQADPEVSEEESTAPVEESKEEPAPQDEEVNYAAGKSYTVVGNTGRDAGDGWNDSDAGKLTDGVYAKDASTDFLGCRALEEANPGEVSIIIDLGEVKSFGKITADATYGDWGISAPTGARFSVSEDGTTYSDEITVLSEDAAILDGFGGNWTGLLYTAEGDFTGRYVKVTYYKPDDGQSNHIWISEIEVIGEAAAAPVEESQGTAPVEESQAADPVEESKGTAHTGDAGMIALAVVSALALGGAVVVKKSK